HLWYQPKMAECRAPTTINQCRGTASITFGINQRWQNAVPRQPSINVGARRQSPLVSTKDGRMPCPDNHKSM
ncbi:hypothetical protein, partial [Microseira wollei]|uniref:hypothetical protein n=1 Tax=Microseira wollei TaxID=467598 RepID=UPI001CFDCF3C